MGSPDELVVYPGPPPQGSLSPKSLAFQNHDLVALSR
jgi:hypothetical protein